MSPTTVPILFKCTKNFCYRRILQEHKNDDLPPSKVEATFERYGHFVIQIQHMRERDVVRYKQKQIIATNINAYSHAKETFISAHNLTQ